MRVPIRSAVPRSFGAPTEATIRRIATKGKNCTPARVISERDSTAVRLHDLFYDSKTPAYVGGLHTPAPPKPFKYPLPLVDWNSWTVVGNVHAAVREHLHCHLPARGFTR
jgi:hypothetical protein